MFTNKKLAAAVVTLGLTFGASVQAQESSLEQFVSNMVAQTVSLAQEEIANGLQKSVIELSQVATGEEDEQYAAVITIKDIKEGEKDEKAE